MISKRFRAGAALRRKGRLFLLTIIALAACLLQGTVAGGAFAQEVVLPLSMDIRLLSSLVRKTFFSGSGDSASLYGRPGDCLQLRLSDPRFVMEGRLLRLRVRLYIHGGTELVDNCFLPVEWQGQLELLQQPYFDNRNFRLAFRTVESHILNADGQPGTVSNVLWDFASPYLTSYFDALNVDLSGPVNELRGFLAPLFPVAAAQATQAMLDSLHGGEVTVQADRIGVPLLAEVAEIYDPDQDEEPLSEQQREQLVRVWETWDAFLVRLVLLLAGPGLSDEERQLLVDVLLESRYRFSEALDQDLLDQAFVRRQFVWAWARLGPLFRRQINEDQTGNSLGILAFFTAADALQAFDRLGPTFGVEVSQQGLLRLAAMLEGGEVPLAYSLQVDSRLRNLLLLPEEGRIVSTPVPVAEAASALPPAPVTTANTVNPSVPSAIFTDSESREPRSASETGEPGEPGATIEPGGDNGRQQESSQRQSSSPDAGAADFGPDATGAEAVETEPGESMDSLDEVFSTPSVLDAGKTTQNSDSPADRFSEGASDVPSGKDSGEESTDAFGDDAGARFDSDAATEQRPVPPQPATSAPPAPSAPPIPAAPSLPSLSPDAAAPEDGDPFSMRSMRSIPLGHMGYRGWEHPLARLCAFVFGEEVFAATPLPSDEDVLSWKPPTDGKYDEYLVRMEEVLKAATTTILGHGTVPKHLHDSFAEFIVAMAWQESCFRQFIVRDSKLTYLLSYNNSSVGVMQINERVWRGVYDLSRLRWDIRYNVEAGCEISDLYLHRYILKKGSPELEKDDELLFRTLYSMYNGGPGQLDKFLARERRGKSYKSDKLFADKLRHARKGDWRNEVSGCFGGG